MIVGALNSKIKCMTDSRTTEVKWNLEMRKISLKMVSSFENQIVTPPIIYKQKKLVIFSRETIWYQAKGK